MFRRIRWKLLASYLVVVTAAVVFLGVHLARQFEATYTAQLQEDLVALARLVAVTAAGGLASGDAEAVRRSLAVGQEQESPLVLVTDASGVIVGGRGVPAHGFARTAVDPAVRRALEGEDTVGVGIGPDGREAVYAAVPAVAGGRILGAVYVARPLQSLHTQRRHLRWVVAWGTVAAVLIAGALGLLLARGIAEPVQEMQRVASSLAAGRLGERVPVRTRDELGDLARSLNYMASELERIDSLRRAFVADASHELRTPVANLAVAVEALKAVIGTEPDQARAIAADIEREVERLRRLVDSLLDLSLVEAGKVRLSLAPVAPAEVVARAVAPFQPRAARAGVTLRTEVPPRLPRVRADADRTVQVLTNLLDNALKFTPAGGTVTVSASEQRGRVLIAVADTGPGIPEAELPHVFDRFYKVDRARAGSRGGAGLGLAIAKRLVEAQGGIIMAESREGHGARFVVALPKEP